MDPITSTRNPRIAAALRLRRTRERRLTASTLLEGPHLLAAAAEAGADVRLVFHLADDQRSVDLAHRLGAEAVPVDPGILTRLAPTEHPRGPVAVLGIPAGRAPTRDVLFLEVTDPGNAGTLIRTATAFGFDVVVADGAVDPWSPKVLRAAAGAHFSTRIASGALPAGWGIVATLVQGGRSPAELAEALDPARRWGIAIGSEAHGLSPAMVDRSDVQVTIPTTGDVESLNAAVAGAVVAYELSRWRTRVGTPGADG
ncbi:MAG: RNA methyltransferase [Acidimicrobiia bacterium]|jgi:RNA methyltransferase, TrmH family